MRMIKRIINKKSAYQINSFSFYATAEISTTVLSSCKMVYMSLLQKHREGQSCHMFMVDFHLIVMGRKKK